MTTKRNFLKEFFKDKQMVGAISPSTKFLGEKMLSSVDFEKEHIIAELGPGTGVFTDLIIAKMAPEAKLLVFELNESFCEALKNRISDPRVQVIHDSAENISKYLNENEKCDVVVSSLPLMVFSPELRNSVVKASYESLREDGKYVQFQYSLQSKKLLESVFKSVKVRFTLKNFPPAFVYTCQKH
ncbi:MAG: class I SAM-dependent methyltransferase [Crocinitomicaceae bacterium]